MSSTSSPSKSEPLSSVFRPTSNAIGLSTSSGRGEIRRPERRRMNTKTIASHVRIGELYPPLVPLTTAMLAWLGIFLRDGRVRALLPFRSARK
jgi:hypothetical protein